MKNCALLTMTLAVTSKFPGLLQTLTDVMYKQDTSRTLSDLTWSFAAVSARLVRC